MKGRLIAFAALTLALVLGLAERSRAQSLDAVSRAVHGTGGGGSGGRSGGGSYGRRGWNGGAVGSYYWLVYPFLGPLMATGDRWEPDWWLADYPYADGVSGYAIYLPKEVRETDPAAPPVQDVAAQVRVEGGYLIGGIARTAGEILLMLPYRIELDVGGVFLAQQVPGGNWNMIGMETAHFGLRFAQDEVWQFHAAVGLRTFHDRTYGAFGITPGFDFRYTIDIFPVQPLVVSIQATLGDLGSAFVFGGRLTLGLMLGPVELYLGYDHLSFVSKKSGALPYLSGVLGGLRFWI